MDSKSESISGGTDFINSILNNSPFGIIVFDLSGIISLSNKLVKTLLGLETSLNNLPGLEIIPCVEHIPALSERLRKCLQKGGKRFILDGEQINGRYLNIIVRPINSGYILIIDDITKIKELEANSILSILAGQENERRRLAREIHDGMGPLLSSIKLDLDFFMDEYSNQENKPPLDKLINMRETIDTITGDLRDLSHHLLPRLLDEFGLLSAFNSLTSRINNSTKTVVEFYCNLDSGRRFDKDIELNIYRCGQELINNAVKYAKASEILVQLILHEKSIVLMVEDDGGGFERTNSSQDGFGIGLTNIDTRVRTINGEFTLDSVKNQGTTASIEIPL